MLKWLSAGAMIAMLSIACGSGSDTSDENPNFQSLRGFPTAETRPASGFSTVGGSQQYEYELEQRLDAFHQNQAGAINSAYQYARDQIEFRNSSCRSNLDSAGVSTTDISRICGDVFQELQELKYAVDEDYASLNNATLNIRDDLWWSQPDLNYIDSRIDDLSLGSIQSDYSWGYQQITDNGDLYRQQQESSAIEQCEGGDGGIYLNAVECLNDDWTDYGLGSDPVNGDCPSWDNGCQDSNSYGIQDLAEDSCPSWDNGCQDSNSYGIQKSDTTFGQPDAFGLGDPYNLGSGASQNDCSFRNFGSC